MASDIKYLIVIVGVIAVLYGVHFFMERRVRRMVDQYAREYGRCPVCTYHQRLLIAGLALTDKANAHYCPNERKKK